MQFNYAMTYNAWGPNFTFCYGHVCHAGELPFVFVRESFQTTDDLRVAYMALQHANRPGMFGMNPQEEAMSRQIVNWWTNFAHTGNPNLGPNPTSGSSVWPAYNAKQRTTMNIALQSKAEVYPRSNMYAPTTCLIPACLISVV